LNFISDIFLTSREWKMEKTSHSSKMLYNFTCIFSFVFFSFYTAVLTSLMTTNVPPAQIKSFEDVLDRKLGLFLWCGSVDAELLRMGEEGSAKRRLYEKLGEVPCISSVEEALQRLNDYPNSVFFGSTVAFPSNANVRILTKFEEAQVQAIHFVYRKDSQLLPLFERTMLKMRRGGLLSLIVERWYGEEEHFDQEGRVVESLGLDNLFFPCGVLFCGGLASFALCGVEVALKLCSIHILLM